MRLASRVGVLLFMFVCGVATQTTDVRNINSYVRSIDSFVKNGRNILIVANTADYDKEKPEWKRFDSEADLEKFREKTETYTIAYNFRKGGNLVASNFTKFSPSGDWAKYLNHYFRNDGSLAKVTRELRTFYGDFIVIEDLYFDRKGKQLKKSVRYLDLTSHKPKKPSKEDLDGFDFTLKEKDFYKRSSNLPFAELLSKPSK